MSALLRQEIGFFDHEENSATQMTGFLAEKVSLVKSLTTDKLDLLAQLVGGFGAVLVILFGWCSWQVITRPPCHR